MVGEGKRSPIGLGVLGAMALTSAACTAVLGVTDVPEGPDDAKSTATSGGTSSGHTGNATGGTGTSSGKTSSGGSVSSSGTTGPASGGTAGASATSGTGGGVGGTATGNSSSGTAGSGGTGASSGGVTGDGFPTPNTYFSEGPAIGSPRAIDGYTFAYSDGMSTSSVGMDTFCATGSDVMADSAFKYFGAGVGVNVDQVMATSGSVPPLGVATETGTSGLSYALTGIDGITASAIRINVCTVASAAGCPAADTFCVGLTSASGTIPWGAFNTECYDNNAGTALTDPPPGLAQIQFLVPSTLSGPIPSWSFCVQSLSIQ